jgi:hypothetical protein
MATVVISYARVDQPLVRAVVKLLRAALREFEEPVYWDEDFEPGDAWLDQIKRSIDGAPQVFVFWCAHSAGSRQVAEEFRYALSTGKRVVPILLDSTALIPELGRIHGVDLREAVNHRSPPPADVAPRPIPSASAPRPWPAPSPAPSPADECRPVPRRRAEPRGGWRARAALGAIGLGTVGAVAAAAASLSTVYVVMAATFGIAALGAAALVTRGRATDPPSLPPLAEPVPPLAAPRPRAAEDIRLTIRTRQDRDALQSIDPDALLRAFQRDLPAAVDGPAAGRSE